MACQTRAKNFVKSQSKAVYRGDTPPRDFPAGIYTRHHPNECNLALSSRPIHLARESAYEGKNVIQLVSKDNVRELLIPQRETSVYPAFWSKGEYERIMSKATVSPAMPS